MQSLFDLTGKVAVVTGSSRGIGKSIAMHMALHGAKVMVSSRKMPACEEVVAEINAACQEAGSEGGAAAQTCHIANKEQLQELVDATRAQWGKIDILVANAASNPYFGSIRDIPDDAFDKVMENNVRSNHWLCNMVVDEMSERGSGSIIVVSSIGGIRGSAVLGAYAISKAADMQLVRNLAVEFGPKGVRANAIAPGLVRTDFARALWENPDILKASTAGSPLRRIGEPDEIAGIAVYLASNAGNFTTGQTILVDGGSSIALEPMGF